MYKPKVTKEEFELWFRDNPAASLEEIMEEFGIQQSTAYQKKAAYFKKHPYDPDSSHIAADIHSNGVSQGFMMGLTAGVLIGDTLKSQGLGISDLLKSLSAWIKPQGEV